MKGRPISDVVIAGAGLIGLTLALELERRGARVTVLDTGMAMRQASVAAAGMLAAEDPHNPKVLLPLARRSVALYPQFLRRVAERSGTLVPFQTETTVQYLVGGRFERIAESSLDPRQLAGAVLAAVRSGSIDLREQCGALQIEEQIDCVRIRSAMGLEFRAQQMVHATGAWFAPMVRPRKGQMLRVKLAAPLSEVHRSERVYVVPRTVGANAGTAVIGATLEDVGFDVATDAGDLAGLRQMAAELLPGIGLETAIEVEAWAGLRPGTRDDLPVLGRLPGSARRFVATGHFRNGVLLAPATAEAMAELLADQKSTVALDAFGPERFGTTEERTAPSIFAHSG